MTTPGAARANLGCVSTASFHQLPTVGETHPQPMSSGRVMGLLVVLGAAVTPRLVIVGFWIFSDLLGDAYDGWVVPALGFVLLPWTTLAYAGMWAVSSNGTSGIEWGVVAVAAIADVLTWAGVRLVR